MRSARYAPRLKVAIAAHAGPGGTGGVARFVGSLIHALGKLEDGDEKYLIVVRSEAHRAWLQPLLGPNQEIVFEAAMVQARRRNRQQASRPPNDVPQRLYGSIPSCSMAAAIVLARSATEDERSLTADHPNPGVSNRTTR